MAVDISLEIAEIANSIVWPTLIGILILKYKNQIGNLMEKLSERFKKISFGSFSVELFETEGFEPKWSGQGLMDARYTAIDGTSIHDLLKQIAEIIDVDYAIFDLEEGNHWLSSRMFMFTIMLQRMKRIKRIVFVDTFHGITRNFIGVVDPNYLRFALASRYPWLEKTFADVYQQYHQNNPSFLEPMKNYDAQQLILNYFNNLEIQNPNPPSENRDQWVQIKNSHLFERAEYINSNKLMEILKDVLNRTCISTSDLNLRTNKEKIIKILSIKKPFVSIVDDDGRFEKLIDREQLSQKILEEILKE